MKQQSILELVRLLCDELNAHNIAYCHWKSNISLDRSASGENDLDLLIDRSSIQMFTEILANLNFKRADENPDRRMPGVVDYYGYDKPSDLYVHVHAHFQLVVGHDATKSYHIPVETAFLKAVSQDGYFKVPPLELELILLVIRMLIKHSTWDVIFSSEGKFTSSEYKEFNHLVTHVSRDELINYLRKYFPWYEPKFFDECVAVIEQRSSIWARLIVGWKLQGFLNTHARRSILFDALLKKMRWFNRGVRRRLFHHRFKKRLSNGGLVIAIVGGDGAGKTTALEEINKWLSKEFEVRLVHMGKPAWSWNTIFVRGILKAGSLLRLYPFARIDDMYMLYSEPPAFPGYPWLIREVCTARDRFLTYRRLRRFASNGGVVLCDRFPLKQIKLMDGPQVERLAGSEHKNKIIKMLIKMEERYYVRIMLPEVVVVLKVSPEVSVLRKTDESPNTVRVRAGEIWDVKWQDTSAYVIDASKPRDQVIRELKTLIWSKL